MNLAKGNSAFPPDDIRIYRKVGDTELELFVFRPDRTEGPAPAVVFFHGGGWMGGDPSQFFPQCRHLASRGLVTCSVRYRLKKVHGTSPFDCVADGRAAMRWVRAHAEELGIDPSRIAAGGGSAGGHVAAACAIPDGEGLDSRPDALLLFNPVYDNGPGGYGHDRLGDRWREISPLHNLGPDTPPTLVLLGTEDHHIPVATAETYHERMRSFGVRCDTVLYPGQPHGFFNYNQGDNPYYTATLIEADRFLTALGYLEDDSGMVLPDVPTLRLKGRLAD